MIRKRKTNKKEVSNYDKIIGITQKTAAQNLVTKIMDTVR